IPRTPHLMGNARILMGNARIFLSPTTRRGGHESRVAKRRQRYGTAPGSATEFFLHEGLWSLLEGTDDESTRRKAIGTASRSWSKRRPTHARRAIAACADDYSTSDRTHRSITRCRRSAPQISTQPAVTLRCLTAPRAGRLLKPRHKAYQMSRP